MKLIWHIFRKDLRRLQTPLALWSGVIVLQYLAWWAMQGGENFEGQRGSQNLALWLWGLHLVAAWLLVPQLIHEDPLIGDQAAWRTRPISGGRLLAAKIFGMAMMLWLWPSLLTVPWWIEFGFGPGEIVRALAVNTVGMATFTSGALLVAVLTENFARFLAWSLVLAVGAALGGLILMAGVPANGEGVVSASVLMTRASLAAGVGFGAVAVVVPLQFLRRRTMLGRGIAGAAALVAVVIMQAWPWSAAQMLDKTGLKKFALPVITARVSGAGLMVPAEAERLATVRVTTEFAMRGLAAGDSVNWTVAEPRWKVGEHRVVSEPLALRANVGHAATVRWLRGEETPRDEISVGDWKMKFSGKLVSPLREGQGVVGASNTGAIWRGERGPVVAAKSGAGAARGWRQLHVVSTDPTRDQRADPDTPRVSWLLTEPLFFPMTVLGPINPSGVAKHEERWAVLMNGEKEIAVFSPQQEWLGDRNTLGLGTLPVGLVGVTRYVASFDRRWSEATGRGVEGMSLEGAKLATAIFREAAPIEVQLAETPFIPDLVIEGRLDEALKRAKAEDKWVVARVRAEGENEQRSTLDRWSGKARELLTAQFVCAQVGGEEAARLRKRTGEEPSAFFVVFNPAGEERDRLRDLADDEFIAAMKANLAGKTYAAVLMEELAARGGDDRQRRFQLHEALRARGELAGAFDAILWLLDHQRETFEAREVVEVGWRLERAVATYGPAKAALLERRERAVEALRTDARDVGAARVLWVITLGLRHDDAVWREFPRLLPRENPSWWEFTGNWISRTVVEKRYREAVDGVDLEKFFAEGPAWMREQLLRKQPAFAWRSLSVADWQQRLAEMGGHCVEALAGAGQNEAALRVALEVRRVDRSLATRVLLREALKRGGATAEAERLMTEKIYGH